MKIIEWDDDGYPTEESLEKLQAALADVNFKRAAEAFYAALEENSYYEACGYTKVDVRGTMTDVWEYHTLGWSGNESIIHVLEQSIFWKLYLERHDGGGHYYFQPKEEVLKNQK